MAAAPLGGCSYGLWGWFVQQLPWNVLSTSCSNYALDGTAEERCKSYARGYAVVQCNFVSFRIGRAILVVRESSVPGCVLSCSPGPIYWQPVVGEARPTVLSSFNSYSNALVGGDLVISWPDGLVKMRADHQSRCRVATALAHAGGRGPPFGFVTSL